MQPTKLPKDKIPILTPTEGKKSEQTINKMKQKNEKNKKTKQTERGLEKVESEIVLAKRGEDFMKKDMSRSLEYLSQAGVRPQCLQQGHEQRWESSSLSMAQSEEHCTMNW